MRSSTALSLVMLSACYTQHEFVLLDIPSTVDDASTPDTAPQTPDAGTSPAVHWERATIEPTDVSLRAWAAACAKGTTHCMVAGSDGYVLVSKDSGKTWMHKLTNAQGDLGYVLCPTASTCYVKHSGAWTVTHDFGDTWSTLSVVDGSGISYVVSTLSCVDALQCTALAHRYGYTQDAWFYTADGGLTWSKSYPNETQSRQWLHCFNDGTCAAWYPDSETPDFHDGRSLISSDRGLTFQPGQTGLSLESYPICVENACFAVTANGIAKSTDQTRTWSEHVSALTVDSTPNAFIDCPSEKACYFRRGSLLLRTSDGGLTGETVYSSFSNVTEFACADATHCILTDSYEIFYMEEK